MSPSNVYNLPFSYNGTGNVIYQGSFYYYTSDKSHLIVRYDLKLKKVVANYSFEMSGEDTALQLNVDEDGLWLVLMIRSKMTVVVSKLEHESLKIQRVIKIALNSILVSNLTTKTFQSQHEKAFNTLKDSIQSFKSFIICGKIYIVEYLSKQKCLRVIVSDLKEKKERPFLKFFKFSKPLSKNSFLAYNPFEKKLYGWFSNHLLSYALSFPSND